MCPTHTQLSPSGSLSALAGTRAGPFSTFRVEKLRPGEARLSMECRLGNSGESFSVSGSLPGLRSSDLRQAWLASLPGKQGGAG